MSSFSWVGLINKMLNLAVLGAACVYLAKKYAYPVIKKNLEHRDARVLDLKRELVSLQEKGASVTQQTAEHRTHAAYLLGKMRVWKEALEMQKKERDSEQSRIQAASNVYLKMRAEGLCHEYLKRTITTEVFERTEKELREFFSVKKHQNQYIATHLTILKKRGQRG